MNPIHPDFLDAPRLQQLSEVATSRPLVTRTGTMVPGPNPLGAPSYGASILKTGGALLVILAAFFVASRVLRRRGSPTTRSRGGRLEIIDVLRLEPRRSLYLVRVDDGVEMIAASETGLTRLGTRAGSSVPSTLAGADFASRLGFTTGRSRGPSEKEPA